MEYDEFITHVQSLTQSDSGEEAERATRATLETLKERIANDEAQELTANLPQQLGDYLRGKEGKEGDSGGSFNLQEFITRASQKEDIEPTTVAIHVRAVFTVLQNAISPELFAALHSHFSHDYEELFGT